MRTKKCYMCKEVKDLDEFHADRNRHDGHTSRCKECNKIFERGRKREPRKDRARSAIKDAVFRKAIPPVREQECVVCGRQAEEYHHWSYDEQYKQDVIPLCHQCHARVHAGVFFLNIGVVKHVYPVV